MYDIPVRMDGRDFVAQLLDMAVDGAVAYDALVRVVYKSADPISL
jgi:hypothetical protein